MFLTENQNPQAATAAIATSTPISTMPMIGVRAIVRKSGAESRPLLAETCRYGGVVILTQVLPICSTGDDARYTVKSM